LSRDEKPPVRPLSLAAPLSRIEHARANRYFKNDIFKKQVKLWCRTTQGLYHRAARVAVRAGLPATTRWMKRYAFSGPMGMMERQ
jgi:hypothetical protein